MLSPRIIRPNKPMQLTLKDKRRPTCGSMHSKYNCQKFAIFFDKPLDKQICLCYNSTISKGVARFKAVAAPFVFQKPL